MMPQTLIEDPTPKGAIRHPLRKKLPVECDHDVDDLSVITTSNGLLIICKPCWLCVYLWSIHEIFDHPFRKKLPEECDHDVCIIPTEDVPLVVCKSCWLYTYFEVNTLEPQ